MPTRKVFIILLTLLWLGGLNSDVDGQVVNSSVSSGISVGGGASRGSSTLSTFRSYSTGYPGGGRGSGGSGSYAITAISGSAGARRAAGSNRINPRNTFGGAGFASDIGSISSDYQGTPVGRTLAVEKRLGLARPKTSSVKLKDLLGPTSSTDSIFGKDIQLAQSKSVFDSLTNEFDTLGITARKKPRHRRISKSAHSGKTRPSVRKRRNNRIGLIFR